MRIIGLLALAILLPVCAFAVELININTADATLLDTLVGIGPAKAADIVEYRTQHGSFAIIEDIQKVSGIGPVTFENMKDLITVGDTSISNVPDTGSDETASSTPSTGSSLSVQSSSSGGATTRTPPPSVLSVHISGSRNAILEIPLRLSARATDNDGAVNPSAYISWNFGDGSSAIGSAVEKVYRYAGTYLVVVDATYGDTKAYDELIVTAKPTQVRLSIASGGGITIANDSSERLDLSGWQLLSGANSFRILEGTVILPKMSVLFPSTITNLPVSLDTMLLYPSGSIAIRYMPPARDGQLSEPVKGFNTMQTVEPIISTKANVQIYEEAVGAPTTTVEPAAVGAALIPSSTDTTKKSGIFSVFNSPWTLGLLGVILLAGTAFILL